jgi:hypothetical protein
MGNTGFCLFLILPEGCTPAGVAGQTLQPERSRHNGM